MDLTISVRESDVPLLEEIARRDWRDPAQEACALLEQALRTERARAAHGDRPRATTRRTPRSNGAVRVEA